MALARRASLGSNPRTPPRPQAPHRDPNVLPRDPWVENRWVIPCNSAPSTSRCCGGGRAVVAAAVAVVAAVAVAAAVAWLVMSESYSCACRHLYMHCKAWLLESKGQTGRRVNIKQ